MRRAVVVAGGLREAGDLGSMGREDSLVVGSVLGIVMVCRVGLTSWVGTMDLARVAGSLVPSGRGHDRIGRDLGVQAQMGARVPSENRMAQHRRSGSDSTHSAVDFHHSLSAGQLVASRDWFSFPVEV